MKHGVEESVYTEVRVDVANGMVDVVSDYIIEHLAGGLVLEEEEDQPKTTLVFYVTPERDRDMELFRAKLGDWKIRPDSMRSREIKDIEWIEAYKQSIQPVVITENVVVRPPWADASGAKYDIIVEPRMAFGTGSHGTTRGSIEAIERSFQEGWSFLDMGCGSGVLSIMADKMGASKIKAVDYDPVATANCVENFTENKVQTPNEVVTGSIEACESDEPYDFVVANIIRSTILEMMTRLVSLARKEGFLVLSGLLPHDEEPISKSLREHGQTDFQIQRVDNWLTYTVRIH